MMRASLVLLLSLTVPIVACAKTENLTPPQTPGALSCGRSAPTLPSVDSCFLTLTDGRDLTEMSVSGTPLSFSKGQGHTFTQPMKSNYELMRDRSKTDRNSKLYWALIDLESGRFIDQSVQYDRRIFGASVSKLFVAATLLNQTNGRLSDKQYQLVADMLVVSSNTAWQTIQKNELGGGNNSLGQQLIDQFTRRMGYIETRGYMGYWGDLHGNELTAKETAMLLYDTYHNRFAGAEVLWKMMFTVRTGGPRGRKYLSSQINIGAKTGTYAGPTIDPYTEADINVNVNHHTMIFEKESRAYGLVVFADQFTQEQVAQFSKGVINQHLGL